MKASRFINLFFRLGLFDLFHHLWPSRLTVLAYHRIAALHAPGFDTFKPNVSATPAAFAAQMDFLRQRFSLISIDDLLAWLEGQKSLPPRPALITFDDGYRDNLEQALPVLRQHNFPAVIFLATDYIDSASPFYWDLIAYCFYHTSLNSANLPLLGCQEWRDEKSRNVVMATWLNRLKTLPDAEKWTAVRSLPHLLQVTVPPDAFAGLHLTWDQVRLLVNQGVDMGAHTQSHPILTRVSLGQARTEITGSRSRIETEIERPVTTLAYPNGLPTDFNPALQALLKETGFQAAFTLVPGPARLGEIQQEPLAIRRVFIHHRDTLPRFAAKVIGLPRLFSRFS